MLGTSFPAASRYRRVAILRSGDVADDSCVLRGCEGPGRSSAPQRPQRHHADVATSHHMWAAQWSPATSVMSMVPSALASSGPFPTLYRTWPPARHCWRFCLMLCHVDSDAFRPFVTSSSLSVHRPPATQSHQIVASCGVRAVMTILPRQFGCHKFSFCSQGL